MKEFLNLKNIAVYADIKNNIRKQRLLNIAKTFESFYCQGTQNIINAEIINDLKQKTIENKNVIILAEKYFSDEIQGFIEQLPIKILKRKIIFSNEQLDKKDITIICLTANPYDPTKKILIIISDNYTELLSGISFIKRTKGIYGVYLLKKNIIFKIAKLNNDLNIIKNSYRDLNYYYELVKDYQLSQKVYKKGFLTFHYPENIEKYKIKMFSEEFHRIFETIRKKLKINIQNKINIFCYEDKDSKNYYSGYSDNIYVSSLKKEIFLKLPKKNDSINARPFFQYLYFKYYNNIDNLMLFYGLQEYLCSLKDYLNITVNNYKNGKEIPVSELFENNEYFLIKDNDNAINSSACFIEYLIKNFGFNSVKNICRTKGYISKKYFIDIFNKNFQDIENNFREYIRKFIPKNKYEEYLKKINNN